MVTGANSTIQVPESIQSKNCAYCGNDLQMKEGVTIFDKRWYHDGCWSSFDKQQEVERLD